MRRGRRSWKKRERERLKERERMSKAREREMKDRETETMSECWIIYNIAWFRQNGAILRRLWKNQIWIIPYDNHRNKLELLLKYARVFRMRLIIDDKIMCFEWYRSNLQECTILSRNITTPNLIFIRNQPLLSNPWINNATNVPIAARPSI